MLNGLMRYKPEGSLSTTVSVRGEGFEAGADDMLKVAVNSGPSVKHPEWTDKETF